MERMSFMDCDVLDIKMPGAAKRQQPCDLPGNIPLRDWFAGLALSNLCSHSIPKGQVDVMAEFAYCLADAMLRERAKPNIG